MQHITVEDAQAWADGVKLNIATLDSDLEDSISTQVLAEVSQAYDVSSWTSSTGTPSLIRKIIAMEYVGWYFQRVYSEDDEANSYGLQLISEAKSLIAGIVAGTLNLPDAPAGSQQLLSTPLFYPTDLSSSTSIRDTNGNDTSVGPSKFSMGQIW